MVRSYEEVLKHLADNIKELRGKQKLSQEQLALLADVDRTYVSQIEREIGNPSIRVLCRVSAVLKVDVVDLFTASEIQS